MEEPNEKERKWQRVLKFPAGFILGFLIIAFLYSLCSPMCGRSKKLAKRAICGANLKEIGTGILLYAAEHDDLFPSDLATLVQADYVSPEMLICPSCDTEPSPTTRPADVEAHCDYIYVPGMSRASGDIVLAFELPTNHGQECVNALYVDTHVKGTGDMAVFAGELQRLNDYIAEERGAKR